MFSLAMLSVVLFLAVAVTSALRDSASRVYLRHFEKPGVSARIVAGAARAAALLFAGAFYICIGIGVLGLIYAMVLFGAYTLEMFVR